MTYPSVTVICLCYNHEQFLVEALDSVLAQTYPNLEIIVADDASTDQSVAIILNYCQRYPQIKFVRNTQNVGNCTAFNLALKQATGTYIIDFATDDVMLPERITEQVTCFEKLSPEYGVIYSDAELIDEDSQHIRNFYRRNQAGALKPKAVSGEIYADVLARYFICTPTLMFRKVVLDRLNGYDSSLAYEDYDFLVRAAREYKFYFQDKILTKRRKHSQSLSAGWYKVGDKQLLSTIQVCYKALKLNRTEQDKQALIQRVEWETQQAFFTQNYPEAEALLALLKQVKPFSLKNKFFKILINYRVNLSFIHRFYYWLVHRQP
ncbi:glycosyltransferase family 2 protein [Adhaeribacter swui]|uniref:Glycosyltransferase family 2 protein n=1 Tax=Adhaeribacter swui TaxID=2086471 RepID=A0A7G7GCL7_9BACT|nr:glycosyltransferase family A protein [Adhaeribacter swui]QNF34901.1 glycosyltransferase family 2 protein [Adhaeribacter swui]